MPGLMIDGDTSLFENAEEFDFRDELVRYMFVTVERGPGKVLCVRGVHVKDLASFQGPLFQVDRDDDTDAIVLRQVKMRFRPWSSPLPAFTTVEELLLAAFEGFYESLSQAKQGWFAKERDCVNRFVMSHLVPFCSPESPIKHPSQIGTEVPVKMPEGIGTRLSSLKDVVIWDAPFGTCWTPDMKPTRAPIAVLEWKSQRETGSKQDTAEDCAWLEAFCTQNPASHGYSVFLYWTADGILREVRVSRCSNGTWNKSWFDRP